MLRRDSTCNLDKYNKVHRKGHVGARQKIKGERLNIIIMYVEMYESGVYEEKVFQWEMNWISSNKRDVKQKVEKNNQI